MKFLLLSRARTRKCVVGTSNAIIWRKREESKEDTSDGRMEKKREESGGIRSNCRE